MFYRVVSALVALSLSAFPQGTTARLHCLGTDASSAKHLTMAETYNLEIRADITNRTNTPTFGLPTTTFNSTTFGRIRDNVLSGSRKIQMGVRFYF